MGGRGCPKLPGIGKPTVVWSVSQLDWQSNAIASRMLFAGAQLLHLIAKAFADDATGFTGSACPGTFFC